MVRSRAGRLEVRLARPDVVETVYGGYITLAEVQRTFPEFKSIVEQSRPAWWMLNAEHMDGFEAAASKAGSTWFELFCKVRKDGQAVLVAPQGAVRMAASALAFAARLPLKVVATRAEAEALIARTGASGNG